MEHFWKNVPGWFSDDDVNFYRHMVDTINAPAHFVEVGCWKGRSASFMAVEIIRSGKQIQFDCVDNFIGDPNEPVHQTDPNVINGTLFEEFQMNLKPVEGRYRPVRLDSVSASKLYQDNSLDFVFIDAAHDYESVKADINSWMPKLKLNGILAGHDYYHPPVMKAVQELIPNVEIWSTNFGSPWVTYKK